MPIIKSISGIRGTIGNKKGEDLRDEDIVNFALAYISLLINKYKKITIVIGRDARISGKHIKDLVIKTLIDRGVNVIDLDLATTPTVEMSVIEYQAQGGIIITASHNPQEWNALKFLNNLGEFVSKNDIKWIIEKSDNIKLSRTTVNKGSIIIDNKALDKHIKKILKLDLVNAEKIKRAHFSVLVDGINSVGGVAIPKLLKVLGVDDVSLLNCETNGYFAHNPEPIEKNLLGTLQEVKRIKVDLGIVVDPDVDRLAFIDENAKMFGEEYTLVSVAQYIFRHYSQDNKYKKVGVSNLSSSRALHDICLEYKAQYYPSAVGELNVVEVMKEKQAIIGGEGNGGVIYPSLHYGRDALVGLALFLSLLAEEKIKVSELKLQLPQYKMLKERIEIDNRMDLKKILLLIKEKYKEADINDLDGLKIDCLDSWVHVRLSNTEPIIRIYAEAKETKIAQKKINEIKAIILANI